MEIFELLKNNKGTTSSALGKELASKVINGDHSILLEAIKYVTYDIENPKSKSIRAGAAKIIEIVSQKKPELVAFELNMIKPALRVSEPQTRWMLMQTFGFCAKLNPKDAISVLDYSKQYLAENAGVCLSGAVHLYLGRIGATSNKTANEVLIILDDSLKTASENEIDWILEGFFCIIDNLDSNSKILIQNNAELFLNSKKKSTQKRAQKIIKKINKG
jgi:hypothetical protein